MFKYLISVLLFCISFNLIADSKEKQQIEILTNTIEQDINKVWPKFELKSLPTIVHFNNGHIYSFGLTNKEKWTSLLINGKTIYYCEEDKWGITKVMMHPSFKFDNQKAFIFKLNEEISEITVPILTFVHERFHLHQFKYFNREDEKSGNYSKEWDEQNQILIATENWLLNQFIKEKDSLQRYEILKDFISINNLRQKGLDQTSITWENLQQRMEGLADYVCLKTFTTFPLLGEFSAEETLLKMRDNKLGAHFSLVNDAIKGRHYFIGAALGFALDFCQADWKDRVEQGAALNMLLAEVLALPSHEIERRVAKIKESAQYRQISQNVKQKLSQERGELDKIVTKYNNLEGIEIHLGRPMQPFSGGGQNHKSLHIGDGKTVITRDISYASSSDNQWKLRFKDIPVVFENGRGGRIFKIGAETMINIDHQPVRLKDLVGTTRSISFSLINWQDRHCDLDANMKGHLQIIDGKVFIQFVRPQAHVEASP